MQQLMAFLHSLGPLNWFILALAMLVLESVIPGVHFMWFGLAAVIVGSVAIWFEIPVAWQLVGFGALSLAMILVVRQVWRPGSVKSDLPDLNVRGQQYVGRLVTVEEEISNGRGKVRVGDTVWTAEGPDMPRGTQVKVTGVNGTVLVVSATA